MNLPPVFEVSRDRFIVAGTMSFVSLFGGVIGAFLFNNDIAYWSRLSMAFGLGMGVALALVDPREKLL